jgi:2-amino-4-hydroxy-6-hydroxymethyldihydropteridine diphosphokinase
MPPTAYIALGANLGEPLRTFAAALCDLERAGCTIVCVSQAYRTAPLAIGDQSGSKTPEQPTYWNAAAALRTPLSPQALLDLLLATEAAHGRVRPDRPGAARTLDLDLLLYGDRVSMDQRLCVPHPRLHERPFVLVPLCEIAASIVHPRLLVTLAELYARLPATPGAPGHLLAETPVPIPWQRNKFDLP